MCSRKVVLYSSTVVILLALVSSLLTLYSQNQASYTPNTVQTLQTQRLEPSSEAAGPRTMAWLYPGEPACDALWEAATIELQTIKPEFFAVRDGGRFELLSEAEYGCNGYSQETVEKVQALAPEQFVVVSASYARDMDLFLKHDLATTEYTQQLVEFVLRHNLTGVEIDFEDYGGWTPDIYERYKQFLRQLGTALQATNKQLMIDLPPVNGDTEEGWYQIRLAELELLPVDYIVIMAYDYQYDHGTGQPVTPLDWLRDVVLFTKNRMTNDEKIVIGLPLYGYSSVPGTAGINIVTHAQASTHPLYTEAVRDERSGESIASSDGEVLVYQTPDSLTKKIAVVHENGVYNISLWHLGGNAAVLR